MVRWSWGQDSLVNEWKCVCETQAFLLLGAYCQDRPGETILGRWVAASTTSVSGVYERWNPQPRNRNKWPGDASLDNDE